MSETNTADYISRWPGLGITLPEELTDFIRIYETLRWTEVAYKPRFDKLREVTTENAYDLVHEFAQQLALAGAPGGGLSLLEKAKKEAVEAAAWNVCAFANGAVSSVIEQLTPTFEGHVEKYIEAVDKLPSDISPEGLLAAGVEAVSAYQIAQQEAGHLNAVSNWVASTRELSMHSGAAEPALRILRPSTVDELFKLDAAHQTPASSPTVYQLDPVLLTAAREGIEFGINTIRGCAALRKKLTTVQQVTLR